MTIDQSQLAKQIVRERSHQRSGVQRVPHPRTARMLRRLANRLDSGISQ